jgi:glutamine synthetase adenylyltransferase
LPPPKRPNQASGVDAPNVDAPTVEGPIEDSRALPGHQRAPSAQFQLLSPLEPVTPDQSNQQVLERLSIDAPALHEIASRQDLNPQTRKNLHRFLASAFTSSQRYAAVLRHQQEVTRALPLFEASDYLTEILVCNPEEIATLAETEELRPRLGRGHLFDTAAVEQSLGIAPAARDPVFAYLTDSGASYDEKLALLREHFRHCAFAVGARDIIELRDVYASFNGITAAAEDAIATALSMAGAPEGLAVLAVGRLGSREFDFLSDADVFFACAEEGDRIALTNCAEKVMHALSAHTREGMVFQVDARLRPRGAEGELLITPTQLAAYFEHEAQAWEALTYTKLRLVAGSSVVGERALAGLRVLFGRFAQDPGFAGAVCDMRTKLEAAEGAGSSFKFSPGAVYDIDFVTSYLLVKHDVPNKQGSLRDRLWRCAAAGLLGKSEAATLDHAAELLRTVEHFARLAEGRAGKWLPATEHGRQMTEKLTAQVLGRDFSNGLENELARTSAIVRAIYDRIFEAKP